MAEAVVVLLLIISAALGWGVARWQMRRERVHQERLADHYFRGLNYLLNEEPDKAIEIFLELAKRTPKRSFMMRGQVSHDVIDTHLALGSLFRRRGEMDKAIRFHKHIIAQPHLTETQRTQALKELGRDYLQAGLLDRAERLFSELVEREHDDLGPAQQLMDIYQQEKDWEQAIKQAEHLQAQAPDQSNAYLAHFYCEMAEQALKVEDRDGAQKALRQARRYRPEHARAYIIAGNMAWREKDYETAMVQYQQACEKDAEAFVLVSERLLDCYQNTGRTDEFRQWLVVFSGQTGLAAATMALAELEAQHEPHKGIETLVRALEEAPTIRGLELLVSLLSAHGKSLASVSPELIGQLMAKLRDAQPRYRCKECGFSSGEHHWCCPSCRQWGTTRLVPGPWGG